MGRTISSTQCAFGNELQTILEAKGLTRTQLCDKVDFNEATLSKYCSGHLKVSAENLENIIAALELTNDERATRSLRRAIERSARPLHQKPPMGSTFMGHYMYRELERTVATAGYTIEPGNGPREMHYDFKISLAHDLFSKAGRLKAALLCVVDSRRMESPEMMKRVALVLPTLAAAEDKTLKPEACGVLFFRTFPNPQIDAELEKESGKKLHIVHGFNLITTLQKLLGTPPSE